MDLRLLLLDPTEHPDTTGRFHADPVCPLFDTTAQQAAPEPTWCVCVPVTPAPQSATLVVLDDQVRAFTSQTPHPAGSLRNAAQPEVGTNGMLNALDDINRSLTDPAAAEVAGRLGDRLVHHARLYYSDEELYHRLALGFIRQALSGQPGSRAAELGPYAGWWQVTETALRERAAKEDRTVEMYALDGLRSALTSHPHDMHMSLSDPERAFQLCGGATRLSRRHPELLVALADLISTVHVAAAQFAAIASAADATAARQLAIGSPSRGFNYVDPVLGLLIVRSYRSDRRVADAMVSAATPRRGSPQLWLLPATLAVALELYDAGVEVLGEIQPDDSATTFSLAVELALEPGHDVDEPLATARQLTR